MQKQLIYFFSFWLLLISCTPKKETIQNPTFIDFKVQNTFPHDKRAFTQGLLIHNGQLYESTGQDDSWIGIVNIQTGVADKKIKLDKKYFGEGITILNNKIYQLTWKDRIAFVYDLNTYEKLQEFKYLTEGWGLTQDSTQLIMSDGTSTLYFRDTLTFDIKKELQVTFNNKPVNFLNELEYINGYIYANVWRTHWIAKINPSDGVIVGFLDLSKLVQQAALINPNSDVLNGVAWHGATQSMLVTGKNWPYIYVLKMNDLVQ
ncbi:MAG TPA: glutaminyl-peptide cyclotransferase [Cyclobacteriaceae bacterium]|nr:glutaminyl-peptide cyclotransferase [Cyclobacteriaceae bacterium]